MSHHWRKSPSDRDARDLHARLVANDPTAPSDLAVAYLDPITDWLVQRYPRVDPNECATAVGEAIMGLIKNPLSYKPERQSLEVYLRMSARGDLRNLLRSEWRHTKRRANWEAVEVSPIAGKYLWDEHSDPALIVERRESEQDQLGAVSIPESVRAGLTSPEVRVLALMDRGERKTSVFAEVLGFTHLPPIEQRREVKRVKDKLNKRLQRAGDRHV